MQTNVTWYLVVHIEIRIDVMHFTSWSWQKKNLHISSRESQNKSVLAGHVSQALISWHSAD